MTKGWKKSQRKRPQWWKSVVAYMKEQEEPVSIRQIIGNAKTYRHNTVKNGERVRQTLLCKSRACPDMKAVQYEFRIRKIPYVQDRKCRLYYVEDDYEIED